MKTRKIRQIRGPSEKPGGSELARSGAPEWVVTYGDMMSLLLTFFIMLVSMSELKNEGRVRAMMDAIREAFGASSGLSGVPGPSHQTTSVKTDRHSEGMRSEGDTKKASRTSPGRAGAHRTVERINHGTVVTLGGPTLFGRFDAHLNDELRRHLDVVVQVVAAKPNRLVIRGHASPETLPADSPFRDPVDLSFARARAVADYLVEKQIDRRRLVISAAGDAEPRLLTRRKEDQSLNRRVDVFLIDSYITPDRQGGWFDGSKRGRGNPRSE